MQTAYRVNNNGNLWDLQMHYEIKILKSQAGKLLVVSTVTPACAGVTRKNGRDCARTNHLPHIFLLTEI
jgi:hypothetical protein